MATADPAQLERLLHDPKFREQVLMYHGLYKMCLSHLLKDKGELTLNLGKDEPGPIYHRTWQTPDGDRMVTLKLVEKT